MSFIHEAHPLFFNINLRRFLALTANLEKCPRFEPPPLLLFYLAFLSPIASPVIWRKYANFSII
jgi:hypothetical protein